ncbi:MAG: cache domain-containing protein [Candidatus Methylomirabilales bacterium]
MTWPSLSSLRVRLLLLVLLALIPARGLGIYTAWEMREAARAEALQDAMRLARIASTAGERLVEGTHQILIVLARLPEVRSQNASACSALFADLLKLYPFYSNFGAATANGDVFCSAVTFEGLSNIGDRTYFRRAVERRDFATGEYQIGRITGKAVINLGYPVLDGAGRVAAVVSAGLDLSWLNRLLAESRLPEHSTITVVDGAGQVLARYPEPEKWVGKSFPDAPFIRAAIYQQDEGTVEGSGLDGTPRLFAFTPLHFGEGERFAYVYIGIPKDSAFAKVNQIDTRSLVGFGGVLAFALLATGIGSKVLILRPVTALVQTMRRLGAGDLSVRTGLPHTPSEIGRLAAALDEMAGGLEARPAGASRTTELLQECEERFRRLADSAPIRVWLSEQDGLRTFFNRAWLDFTGRTPAEAVGSGWLESVHPEDRESCLNVCIAALAARQEFRVEYRLRRADGQYRRVLDTGFPRVLADGRVVGYVGSGRDVIEGAEGPGASR